MTINRIQGWLGNRLKCVMAFGFLVFWSAGLYAVSSGEQCGVSDVFVSGNATFGCCNCQFKRPLKVYTCRPTVPIRFQCDGYSNSSLNIGFLDAEGFSLPPSIVKRGFCIHERYSHCRSGTGELQYHQDHTFVFGCVLSFSGISNLKSFGYTRVFDLVSNATELSSHSQLTAEPLSYPLAIPLNQGSTNLLPMVFFNLSRLSPGQNSQGGLYLEYRLSDKTPGNWTTESTFVNSTHGLSLFLAGPLALGQAIEIRLAGFGCETLEKVARDEHLGDPSLSENPPALLFSWHNVTWPEVLGSVNVTTPDQQPLNTTCLPVEENDFNCTTFLANTNPMGWLLIRAGDLADAETLNFTVLSPLWQIPDKDWQWSSDSQQLTFFWSPPPVAAEGFQISERCQDGSQHTTRVTQQRYEESVMGDCRQNCSFLIAPVYQDLAHENLGLELPDIPVAILCTPTHMVETTSAGYTITLPITVIPTTGIALTTTASPSPDTPNTLLTPVQWAGLAVGSVVVAGVVVIAVAAGCYIKYRGSHQGGHNSGMADKAFLH